MGSYRTSSGDLPATAHGGGFDLKPDLRTSPSHFAPDEAHTIAELARRNQALEWRMDEMAAEFQGRVRDLQEKLNACRAQLEVTTRDADLAREWLVYLSQGIMDSLADAPEKLASLGDGAAVSFEPPNEGRPADAADATWLAGARSEFVEGASSERPDGTP